jgi:phage terminase Nu1 subunit (DNA packaging protein)
MTEPAFNIDPSFPLPARPLNQTELAEVTGADLATISRLVSDGHVSLTDDWREQLRQLYRHWSEQAAGRRGNGPLDIVQERANLARQQADKTNFQLRKARSEFVPVSLMFETLGYHGSAVKNHLMRVPHMMKSMFPDLPIKVVVALDDEVRRTLTDLGHHWLAADLLHKFQEWQENGKHEFDEKIPAVTKTKKNDDKAVSPLPGRPGKRASKKTRRARKEARPAPARNIQHDLQDLPPIIKE